MIERILLPLDGSQLAERALPYAVRLAAMTGARLILMHAAVPSVIPKAPSFSVEAFARKLKAGETAMPASALEGIEIEAVTHDIFAGREFEGICQTITEQQADLLVMSTHGHGGIGRLIFGSVAEQVLGASPVPVVMVTASCERAWSADAPLRILIPLDGSQFAEEVLEPVSNLATALKAELVLLGASGPLEYGYAESAMAVRTGFDAALREARTYLEGVAARMQAAGHTVVVEAEAGRPSAVIEGVTQRRHIDLIAMATHGRSGLARVALGSVAGDVLQQSTVPLLLWRPAGLRHATGIATGSTSAG